MDVSGGLVVPLVWEVYDRGDYTTKDKCSMVLPFVGRKSGEDHDGARE